MAKPTDAALPLSLNDHAKAIFDAAPHPLGEIALEHCKALGIQPWHLIVGHLLKADNRAELHAPLLLDEWTADSPEALVASTSSRGAKICPACKRQFMGPPGRPEARFCCNFCGSGRYVRDQTHHPDCEFFIKPRQVLQVLKPNPNELPPVAPDDPEERLKYENLAYQKHLQEVNLAEQQPGGLPPISDAEMLSEEKAGWSASPRG